jgi:hypothetical protein
VEVNETFIHMATGSTDTGQSSEDTLRIEHNLLVAKAAAEEGRTIVLVEGLSDKAAIDALALRYGRNLADQGITIIAIGGATKIRGFLHLLGPLGLRVKLAGLCDIGEERHFRRALQQAGFGLNLTRSDMEKHGFYICDADLEDELIRSLGLNPMLEVIAAQGDLGRFHLFRRQPEWQDQARHAQLRRWLGTTAHRKISYAKLLVDALDLDRVPVPLERLLEHVAS